MENNNEFSGCTISASGFKSFKCLTEDEFNLLEKNSVKIKYKKGEIISKQGSFISQIMFLEEGLAKVYIENSTNVLLLRIATNESFLGLSALSSDYSTYQYSAKTYVDSVIRQIDINTFRQLIAQNHSFAAKMIDILSFNSVQLYGRFFCLTYKQAYGRLADILICLSSKVFKQNQFELPLSRKDIAELSGMSPETVVRMLKKFNEDNLIRMNGKSLEVLDVEKLQRISETG